MWVKQPPPDGKPITTYGTNKVITVTKGNPVHFFEKQDCFSDNREIIAYYDCAEQSFRWPKETCLAAGSILFQYFADHFPYF